jgi:hypothetical protein
LASVKPLFPVKGKPKPGDWLISHPEDGQTFDQYIESNPNVCGHFEHSQQALAISVVAVVRIAISGG